jgi:hypothetical protein
VANALYDKAREAFLSGAISWSSDTIKVVLVDTNGGTPYTVSISTHQFLSSVPSAARIATTGALTTKTVTAGVADSDDPTFGNVTGISGEAVVIYKDTGTDTTSPLIAYIDTATGLPIVPSGGVINIIWDNGSNKIFKL